MQRTMFRVVLLLLTPLDGISLLHGHLEAFAVKFCGDLGSDG